MHTVLYVMNILVVFGDLIIKFYVCDYSKVNKNYIIRSSLTTHTITQYACWST